MNNKSILVIVLIIAIVAIVGYMGFSQSGTADNQVKVGAATFTMPDGFYVGTSYKNDTNVTNGYDSVYIRDCGNDNVSKYIAKYVKNEKSKYNATDIKIKNFTVNDTVIYKGYSANHTTNLRYWFEHDGEVYLFYNSHASNNFEKIVTDLIMSVK